MTKKFGWISLSGTKTNNFIRGPWNSINASDGF